MKTIKTESWKSSRRYLEAIFCHLVIFPATTTRRLSDLNKQLQYETRVQKGFISPVVVSTDCTTDCNIQQDGNLLRVDDAVDKLADIEFQTELRNAADHALLIQRETSKR